MRQQQRNALLVIIVFVGLAVLCLVCAVVGNLIIPAGYP